MTSFAFTTPNLNNLVAGGNASMGDIQGGFVDLRAFLNGGTIDETNVPNLSAAFTTYKRLLRGAVTVTSAAAPGGLYGFQFTGATSNVAVLAAAPNAGAAADMLIDLDPTEYAANSRVTKLNLRLTAITNAVAPATTFTAALYPISTYTGASGAVATVNAVGALISGSTAALANPGAAARTTITSGDFNFPAAGAYVLGVVPTAAPAAGSFVSCVATLSMRQV